MSNLMAQKENIFIFFFHMWFMPLDSLEIQFYFILNHTLQFPNIQMVGWANLKISVMYYVITLINVLFLVLFLGKYA